MSLSKHYIPCPSTLPPFLSWYLATFRNIVLLGGGSRSGNRARNASCTIVEFWVRAYSVTTNTLCSVLNWGILDTNGNSCFLQGKNPWKADNCNKYSIQILCNVSPVWTFQKRWRIGPFHNVFKCKWMFSLPKPSDKLFLSPVPMNKRFAPGAFLLPKQHERKWILTDFKWTCDSWIDGKLSYVKRGVFRRLW